MMSSLNWRPVVLGTHLFVLALFGLAALAFFVVGETPFYNAQTFYMNEGLIILCAICAYLAYRYRVHVIDVTLGWLYIFALLRLSHYLLSASTVSPPFRDLSLEEINVGLARLLPLLCVFLAAVIVPHALLRGPKGDIGALPRTALPWLVVSFVLMSVAETLVYGSPDASIFSLALFEKADIPLILKVGLTLASADMFLFVIVVWFIARPTNGAKSSLLRGGLSFAFIFGLLLVYIYAAALAGSRNGGFRIFLYAAAIVVIVLDQDWRVLARGIAVAILAVVASIVLLPVSQISRAELVAGQETSFGKASDEVLQDPGVLEAVNGTSDELLMLMLNRLGYMDYQVVTLSREPDGLCRERYLSWSHYAKNVANFVLPGDPFMESRLSSSNAFGICYRGMSEETMPRYHSEIWTVTGLAHIMYGQWALLACAIAGLVLGTASAILRRLAGSYGGAVYAFWVYMFPFTTIFTMGVDHTFVTYITFGLRLAVVLAVAWTGAQVSKAIGHRFRRTRSTNA